MKHFAFVRRLLVSVIALGPAFLFPCAAAPAAPVFPPNGPGWGVQDPLTRILPTESYDGPRDGPLLLAGARNEVVDKQLVLLAGPQAWTGVQLTFSDLRGPGKAVLPRSVLQWRRVGSVMTRKPYYRVDYVGLWPDPLLPPAPFDVPAQGRAFAWVDLHVPPGTPPGVYLGKVTVASHSAAPLAVPLSLHVWGFTLPRQNHLRSCFGVQGSRNFPLNMGALWDDMLAHRISPINCIGDPKPLASAQNGAAQNGAAQNGEAQWDWSEFDRTMPRRLAQGVTGIATYVPPGQPGFARVWQDHLQAHGWLGLGYTYIADEPVTEQLPALNARLGRIKQAAPALKNMMTARGYPEQIADNIDIWCPELRDFNLDGSRREQARGKESWWYPAYPSPHPLINVWIDYPALDCRIWPWLTWKFNLDGMLYWSVCNWQDTNDPLTQAPSFTGPEGAANGDGMFVYPGPNGKPLDSVRWEALRDGMQDYEVFCVLEAGAHELRTARHATPLLAQVDALLAIPPGVVQANGQQFPSPQSLLAAREQMSGAAEQIVKALGHEPRIVARPRLHPDIPRLQEAAFKAEHGSKSGKTNAGRRIPKQRSQNARS